MKKLIPLFRVKEGVQLVLASASPRRRQFLEEWGVSFLLRPVQGEPEPQSDESPEDYVVRSAKAKLLAAGSESGELVIAADTVVALKGKILGKPRDEEDAFAMLRSLAGEEHFVLTGVALAFPDGKQGLAFVDSCAVRFHPWDDAVLRAYIATGESWDKAGAYAIQGQGAFLVKSISGSWSTVVGLPVTELANQLLKAGYISPYFAK